MAESPSGSVDPPRDDPGLWASELTRSLLYLSCLGRSYGIFSSMGGIHPLSSLHWEYIYICVCVFLCTFLLLMGNGNSLHCTSLWRYCHREVPSYDTHILCGPPHLLPRLELDLVLR